jgi:FAD synthase
MNIYVIQGQKPISFPTSSVACAIGNFDGVHLGHQALLKRVSALSKQAHIRSGVIIFDPTPAEVFQSVNSGIITCLKQKLKLFKESGIDDVFILHFDNEMQLMTPDDFILNVLNRLGLKILVCGFDFTFGRQGQGNGDYLHNSSLRQFDIDIIPQISMDNEKISSTRIISELAKGNINKVNQLLGRNWCWWGRIEHQVFIPECHYATLASGHYKVEYNGELYQTEYNHLGLQIQLPNDPYAKICFIEHLKEDHNRD